MSSSTRVDHPVCAEGAEQRSIWCHNGIDLFVFLQIDSTVSTISNAPRSLQPNALVAPPRGAPEESLHNVISCETGSGSDEEPSWAKVVPRDLDGDLDNSMIHVRDREFVAGAASPVVGQRFLEWYNGQDVRSRDHMYPGDQEGFRKQFKYGFSADRNFVRGCDCKSARQNPDERECANLECVEDLERNPSRRDEKPFVCGENRRWSPQVDDDYWVTMDMDRDLDNQVAGSDGSQSNLRESNLVCVTSPSSSSLSENEAVGEMQLEVHANSRQQTIMSKSKFQDIESFDDDAISAACLLLKMSADKCRKELKDLSTLEESHVYNVGFSSVSNERTLAKIAKKTHAASPGLIVRDTRNALQRGARKMKRSPWSHDRYIPRLARHAEARLRGAVRGSQFINRIHFGNPELDEDTDCVFVRTPRSFNTSRRKSYGKLSCS